MPIMEKSTSLGGGQSGQESSCNDVRSPQLPKDKPPREKRPHQAKKQDKIEAQNQGQRSKKSNGAGINTQPTPDISDIGSSVSVDKPPKEKKHRLEKKRNKTGSTSQDHLSMPDDQGGVGGPSTPCDESKHQQLPKDEPPKSKRRPRDSKRDKADAEMGHDGDSTNTEKKEVCHKLQKDKLRKEKRQRSGRNRSKDGERNQGGKVEEDHSEVRKKYSSSKKKKKTSNKRTEDPAEGKTTVNRTYNMFLALPVTNPVIHGAIWDLQEQILRDHPEVSRSLIPPSKSHVTVLVFHAESDQIEAILGAVKAAVQALDKKPIEIVFRGVGNFGNRTYFARCAMEDQLKAAYGAIAGELAKIGICKPSPPEEFTPHLTFAKASRFKDRKMSRKPLAIGDYARMDDLEFGAQIVTEIQLLSMTAPPGSPYYPELGTVVFADKSWNAGESPDHGKCCREKLPGLKAKKNRKTKKNLIKYLQGEEHIKENDEMERDTSKGNLQYVQTDSATALGNRAMAKKVDSWEGLEISDKSQDPTEQFPAKPGKGLEEESASNAGTPGPDPDSSSAGQDDCQIQTRDSVAHAVVQGLKDPKALAAGFVAVVLVAALILRKR